MMQALLPRVSRRRPADAGATGAPGRAISRRNLLLSSLACGATLCLDSCGGIAARGEAPLFSFIFCADLHITSPQDAAALGRVTSAWRDLSPKPDFVVAAGDLTSSGSLELLGACNAKLHLAGTPCYVLPGNHDYTVDGQTGLANFRAVFGMSRWNYLIQQKGVALVFLDVTSGAGARAAVPEETIRWAQHTLPRIPAGMPIIVISHSCLHPDVPRFPIADVSPLFDVLDTKNVLAYFSGHYHANWQGERNGARYISTACMSPTEENHDGSPRKGYQWVDAYATRVAAQFREVQFGQSTGG
jgi:hypothetical protein